MGRLWSNLPFWNLWMLESLFPSRYLLSETLTECKLKLNEVDLCSVHYTHHNWNRVHEVEFPSRASYRHWWLQKGGRLGLLLPGINNQPIFQIRYSNVMLLTILVVIFFDTLLDTLAVSYNSIRNSAVTHQSLCCLVITQIITISQEYPKQVSLEYNAKTSSRFPFIVLKFHPKKSNIHIQIKINVTFLISIPHNFSFFTRQREEDIVWMESVSRSCRPQKRLFN